MVTKFGLTAAALAVAAAFGLMAPANAQVITDVLVRNGAGVTIATDVRTFDENEAGSGLALGFTPVKDSTFSFLYQASVANFNNAGGAEILTPGLNSPFLGGGYEFTVVARIEEKVTSITTVGGITIATFEATGGMASIFYDSALSGGLQSDTLSGAGFDDGHLVGLFDVIAGTGVSTFTTFASGAGVGGTKYDFNVRAGTIVDAAYISGLLGPVTDLHFTSSQVIPPGTSLTTSFHPNAPTGSPDLYPTTAPDGILLKVDGSNTFTTVVPEPETYALMLAGLGAIGFLTRRRRKE